MQSLRLQRALHISQHAQQRLVERGFQRGDIELIYKHGRPSQGRGGNTNYRVDRLDAFNRQHALPRLLQLADAFIVVAPDDVVVTIAWQQPLSQGRRA